MSFFGTKAVNNIDASVCNPIIINQTPHSIVLFLDRGVLYNSQVLQPGEAVGMTRQQTCGNVMPYRIHAVVGDAKSLPTRSQSVRNALSTAVIPTAFLIGTFMAASSAGTMTGPSAALTRLASGVVIRGMIIDKAALAAGSLAASRAAVVADKIIEQYPENFSCRTGLLMPGQRCVVVQGGIEEPLTINTIAAKTFKQKIAIPESAVKSPMDTMQDKLEYYTPSIFQKSATKSEVPEEEAATIEEEVSPAHAEIESEARTAAPLIDENQLQRDEEEQLRWAMEESTREQQDISPSASALLERPPATNPAVTSQQSSCEDAELLKAIEESLKFEEERKRQDAEYQKKLDSVDKKFRVRLF